MSSSHICVYVCRHNARYIGVREGLEGLRKHATMFEHHTRNFIAKVGNNHCLCRLPLAVRSDGSRKSPRPMRFFSANKISTAIRTAAVIGKYSLFFRIFYFGTVTFATRFIGRNALSSGRGGGICAMALPKKLGIAGGAMFAFGIVFFSIAFPPILRSQVKAASKLKNGSEMRDMWSKLPFPMVFKIYVFNVTNPLETSKGEKPIVQEVGPYVYDEWLEKLDLVDREGDDTVEYSTRTTWIFNATKSHPLTGDEIVTVPHLFMLSVIMTAMRDKPSMISVAGKAMDSIFKKPPSLFIETTPHELFFGGLPIDCNVKDFAGTAICSLLKDSTDLIHLGDNRYMFSVFGPRNGTVNNNRVRVKRGLKDVMQVGAVVEYKGEPHQTVWPEGSRCNVLNGTDGTIFPPYLSEDMDIVSFSTDICRSMSTHFDGTYTSVGGMHTNHYVADFGDLSTDTEWKCFCDSDDKCPKKGLYDLFKCLGVPMVVSLPHFYKVDELYLEQVDGLSPQKRKHQLDIDFEPISGTPLSARKRIQFNMFVFPIEKVKTMKTFATALMPLFWIQESITLPKKFLNQVKMLFTVMKAVKAFKYLMIVMGILLVIIAGGLEYRRRQAEKKVNITSVQPQAGNGDTEKKWPLDVNALQADQVPPRYVERD